MRAEPLLTVEGLSKSFPVRRGLADMVRRRRPQLVALDGVSLELRPHETVGIVGESGSGKSTLARCIVRLHEPDAGRITLGDTDLLLLQGKELAAARREMQMVYQDPYSSLNPLITVGSAVSEPAKVHGVVPSGQTADAYAAELLELVGLGAGVAGRRPKELSGGQRQRVAIARAMAVRPKLLIADEPVSALDVSIQAQVLSVLDRLRAEGLAMIFIAHQLPVVAQVADTVLVMYLGRVVESGPVSEVFTRPGHPYTSALLQSQPGPQRRGRRPVLKGEIPSAVEVPTGCRFHTRCPMAQDICARVDPEPVSFGEGRQAWCHFADKVEPPSKQLGGLTSSAAN